MKLKSMQIVGFKSFMDKTSISFPGGISAVVGPNGCGKSNIIDALRWVMGEQSMKQLRGKAREDIIFAGTDGKAPLNMTEVSLTLLNDNGSAPAELKDFSEIMLTRRLYRSGESAYFLNKQPCRLKDFHNVFMGSGMGTKSYAVIQQGNIGAITEAGPDERRFFIEEAAGVTRYKTRKKEALRKVDATQRNLLRISDIIVEIKRHMAGLKRQARKAEIYQATRQQIRQIDILLALGVHDHCNGKILKISHLLKKLKDADLAQATRLKKLDAAMEAIKLERQQKNQEIARQKSDSHEKQRLIDRQENDLVHLGREIKRLTAEIEGIESGRGEFESKNKKIIAEISQVREQNSELDRRISNVRNLIEQERENSGGITENLARLNKILDVCKKNLMDLAAREARYKNIFQNAVGRRENIKRRMKRIDEEMVLAGRKAAETEKQQQAARERLNQSKSDIKELDRRIKAMQNDLSEKTGTLRLQVEKIQTLVLEYNNVRSQYFALKKMADNFEWYKGGVRAILRKKDEMQASGQASEHEDAVGMNNISGLLADILEPEPAFSAATEAVLGESLQYILVKDQQTGLKAVDYLQTHQAGRSGFIPMSTLKSFGNDARKEPDKAACLLDHIAVKPGYETIAKSFLGHVAVTADLDDALTLWNKNGVSRPIVTEQGDVISSRGLIIGGSRDEMTGILAKKQELKKIGEQLTGLEKKQASARKIQEQLEEQVALAESDYQHLVTEKNTVTHEVMEAEKALYKTTEDLKHARSHFEIIQLEQEQLAGEEEDIDREIENSSRILIKIEQEIKEAQDKVVCTTGEISRADAEMENFNRRNVDLQLDLTSLTAKLENSSNTLSRLEEFRDDGIGRFEGLVRELEIKKKKKNDVRSKIKDTERSLTGLYEVFAGLNKDLEQNETDYQSIDASLHENDEMISGIRARREKTLEKIRLLEVEHSQQEIKRDAIENRIEERYHRQLAQFRSSSDWRIQSENMAEGLSEDELKEQLAGLNKKIAGIGEVNLSAIGEYEKLKERFDFLSEQRDDLVNAIDDLHKVIRRINKITQKKFMETFTLVNEKLSEVFPRLFDGGNAKLVLTQPDKPLETGVEFMIRPSGKKLTRMSLLSGGEKALSAIAFVFSIFLIKPASFCLLDEIDAPLDEANIFRFNNLLKIIGEKSQIILITHNKRSMEFADTLFGITMEKKGVSKIVSVNLERAA
ncbi:MAG: chromosome segregation protein SMC [Desulfobacteraceae bacterium 4572_123]|nr:MAG: chromosome segregation protein SMC [Desulfobacteraceae bacterium 4572_123]